MSATAKEKILAAADQLFGQVGFDAASTREIAEASGVNKALIHYHFRNKDALLGALLDRYYSDLADTLRRALQSPGDIRARLHRLVDAYSDFLAEHRNFSTIVQREAAAGSHGDRIRAHMAQIAREHSTD